MPVFPDKANTFYSAFCTKFRSSQSKEYVNHTLNKNVMIHPMLATLLADSPDFPRLLSIRHSSTITSSLFHSWLKTHLFHSSFQPEIVCLIASLKTAFTARTRKVSFVLIGFGFLFFNVSFFFIFCYVFREVD